MTRKSGPPLGKRIRRKKGKSDLSGSPKTQKGGTEVADIDKLGPGCETGAAAKVDAALEAKMVGSGKLKRSLSLLYVYALATGAILTFMGYWDGMFLTAAGPSTFLAFMVLGTIGATDRLRLLRIRHHAPQLRRGTGLRHGRHQ